MPSDFELLDRWRDGDPRAGNDLFRRHFRCLFQFFRGKVDGEADELIQATFFMCVQARDVVRKEGSFRAYLLSLARNELYRHLRHQARNAELDFSIESLAALAPSPSSAAARDERQAALVQALRQLPVQQQLLIELHYWEDMRPRELAVIFDIAEPTARLWLHRARLALRDHIERLPPSARPDQRGAEGLAAWALQLREDRAELLPDDDGPAP